MNEQQVKWHQLTAEEAVRRLHSDASCGLSRKEARARFGRRGKNTLFDRPASFFSLLKAALVDPPLLLTVCVSAMCFLFGEVATGGLALLVLMIWYAYIMIRLYRICRLRNAAELHRSPTATVVRDGKRQVIAVGRVTVGDLILLRQGDIVPADGRLITADRLRVRFSYPSAVNGKATNIEQEKHADTVYPRDAAVFAPQYENLVYGGSEVLAGTATAVVTEISDRCFLGAMEQGRESASQTNPNRELEGITPFARLWSFCSLIGMLILSVIGLLTAPSSQSAFRVFLPICAWVGTTSAAAVCFLLREPLWHCVGFLFSERRRGNGTVLLTSRARAKLPYLTDLVVLDNAGIDDGRLHLDSAYGIRVLDCKANEACDELKPLAEAFCLARYTKNRLPTRAESNETEPFVGELTRLARYDASSLEARIKQFRRRQTEGEAALEIAETQKNYRLRFIKGIGGLAGVSGSVTCDGGVSAITGEQRQQLSEYGCKKMRDGCSVITVLREENGRALLVGMVALRAMELPHPADLLAEAHRLGIRIRYAVSSRHFHVAARLPVGETAVICEAASGEAISEDADLLVGYPTDVVAQLIRSLRKKGRTVGLLVSSEGNADLMGAASLCFACDSAAYHTEQMWEPGCDSITRRDADALLSEVNENGGGMGALLRAVALMRDALKRTQALLGIFMSFQILRTAVFVLSVLFGMATATAASFLTLGLLMDLMVCLLLLRTPVKQSEQLPRFDPPTLTAFFKQPVRWLMPTVAAGIWSLTAGIFHLTGRLTTEAQPTLLFLSLLLMQAVFLIFSGTGISVTKRAVLTCLKFALPTVAVLLLSALIPAVGKVTELGAWSAVSLGLAVFSVLTSLFAVMLFTKRED